MRARLARFVWCLYFVGIALLPPHGWKYDLLFAVVCAASIAIVWNAEVEEYK